LCSLSASSGVVSQEKWRLKMDSGVVIYEGLGIVTIGPARWACRWPDRLLHPSPEALIDGENPGPLRRRQVLSDGPGPAVARRRALPALLLPCSHQERSRRYRASPATLRVSGLPPTLRRLDRHHLRWPSPATADLDRMFVSDGLEPLWITNRSRT